MDTLIPLENVTVVTAILIQDKPAAMGMILVNAWVGSVVIVTLYTV